MPTSPSLLTELPAIIDAGRRKAAESMERVGEGEQLDGSNMLLHGDNLDALARLVASGTRAKLVYLDPPFDSNADYRSRVQTQSDDGRTYAFELHTYTDRWQNGTADYLAMLVPRLVLARELLADDGAVCVHVDWHASHLVRVLLDEIFGRDNFVNSLVWSYRTGGAARTSAVPRKHDDLLLYRRSSRFRVTPLYERQYLDKAFMGSGVDAQGRHYVDTIVRDVLEGAVHLVDGERIREVSVRPVLNLSAERTGYATQKPVGLLELLLRWTTQPDDLVIDPFGGSGTTAVAAAQLGRRFVSIDASERSLVVARSRLDAVPDATYRIISDGPVFDADATLTVTAEAARLTDVLLSATARDRLADQLHPARNTGPDAVAALLAGDGFGALAGWQVWTEGDLVAGAWRDARGHLETTTRLRRPIARDAVLELVDLTGARATTAWRRPRVGNIEG